MDPLVFTPRLKLTLITKACRGSPELEWLHELRSDEKATWWSILGRSKSLEETETFVNRYLSTTPATTSGDGAEGEKSYRVIYAVHHFLELPTSSGPTAREHSQHDRPTEFVGMVTLKSLDAHTLEFPEHLTLPAAETATTLTVELGYALLPRAWGKGYATEMLEAVFAQCERTTSFWAPFSKLYVRALINDENPASQRVMEKSRMSKRGIYDFTKPPVFLAGEWRTRHVLHIWDLYLQPSPRKEGQQ